MAGGGGGGGVVVTYTQSVSSILRLARHTKQMVNPKLNPKPAASMATFKSSDSDRLLLYNASWRVFSGALGQRAKP